ncbi:MAG: hypothetical protein QM647_07965 [Asticcacaulis sp.]|uniref:hypothetical protein n=1 Tax=Asticcacaulis sp. TaxID=1872648 RepID=UPI0039E45956
MRTIPAILLLFILATACTPAPPKDAASAEASEAVRSSFVIPAAPSEAVASSSDGTCLSEIGKAASDRLVQRCLMLSPATHPPCNAANTCQMIRDEIDRSCAMYGPEDRKPAKCTA